jgi:hypothetical protein
LGTLLKHLPTSAVKIDTSVIINVGRSGILLLAGLSGEKVALVGGFASPSRDDLKALIIARGGRYRGGGVANDTTLVVVGECTEYNQKVRSARAMGVRVVTLNDFMESIDISDNLEFIAPVGNAEVAAYAEPSLLVVSTGRFSEASVSELVEVLRHHTCGAEITSDYAKSLLEAKGMPIFMDEVQVGARRDLRVIENKIRELRARE